MKIGKALWGASLGAAVIQAAWAYPDLPERFASHFDASGQPNGWSTKGMFYAIWALCVVAANIAPLTVGGMIRSLPASIVNMPRKDYWFATPERKEQAIGVLEATLCWGLFFVNLILLMAFNGVWSHAKGGPFVFSVPFFVAMFAATILTVLIYPFVGLRVPKDRSA